MQRLVTELPEHPMNRGYGLPGAYDYAIAVALTRIADSLEARPTKTSVTVDAKGDLDLIARRLSFIVGDCASCQNTIDGCIDIAKRSHGKQADVCGICGAESPPGTGHLCASGGHWRA